MEEGKMTLYVYINIYVCIVLPSSFLYKPKKFAKGTKMNFAGLKKVQDRANIVLFLREQAENPVPLP